jgi:para-aminobenzoate synthetase component 1
MKIKNLKWISPLKFAKKISDNYGREDWIFLYSALDYGKSIIAVFPKKKIISDDISCLDFAKNNPTKYDRSWFGCISYEYGKTFEKIPKTKKSIINLPIIYLVNFSLIFEFDHKTRSFRAYFCNEDELDEVLNYKEKKHNLSNFSIKNLSSNFDNDQYLQAIEEIKKMIENGDFYQTNLTRKFFGEISVKTSQDFFAIFLELINVSPANYSAFMRLEDDFIVSLSPELFLEIDKNNNIKSIPIKGTAPRGSNEKADQKIIHLLRNSIKNRSENLMIVDLVRNDLSRVCRAGSVKVKNLFKLTSYKTLHHLSSEIVGKIDKKFNQIDALKACFPPGSMTGAPKIKAMEEIAKRENLDRGAYSGALGYFLSDGSANFSVIIRTIIFKKLKKNSIFEFQVGGAITFDSSAQDELEEIFTKGSAIFKVLKIDQKFCKSTTHH